MKFKSAWDYYFCAFSSTQGYNILEKALDKGDKGEVSKGLDTIREGLEKTIVSELKMFNGCEPKNYET